MKCSIIGPHSGCGFSSFDHPIPPPKENPFKELIIHFGKNGGWIGAATMARMLKHIAHGTKPDEARVLAIKQEYDHQAASKQDKEWTT